MIVDTRSIDIGAKFRAAEESVSKAWGDFTLFGLFEREENPGKWDLVASAPWLTTGRVGIDALIERIGAYFDVKDWKIISAVVPLDETSDFVLAITQRYHWEHQFTEVSHTIINGLPIYHAFIITSNPSSVKPMTEYPSPPPSIRN